MVLMSVRREVVFQAERLNDSLDCDSLRKKISSLCRKNNNFFPSRMEPERKLLPPFCILSANQCLINSRTE